MALFIVKALYEAANVSVTFQHIVYQLSSIFPKQYFLVTVIQYPTPQSCSTSPKSNMMNGSPSSRAWARNCFVVLQLLITPLRFAALIPAVPLYLSHGPTRTENIVSALKYQEQFAPPLQRQAAQGTTWQTLINKALAGSEAPGPRPQSACLEETQRVHSTTAKHRHKYDSHHSPFPTPPPA